MTRARLLSSLSMVGLSAASFLISAAPAQAETYPAKPLCGQSAAALCTEVENYQSAFGHYVGHDEPSTLFYSTTPGSGNNNLYTLYLPKDPPTRPVQDGSGGTFNFQLHPAFWFGMAMCDDQSAPNPGGSSFGATVPCTADSDANIFNSPDPTSPSYIGRHPGSAFMEMQFYPPGWAKWPFGNSCDATRWCAALNIDSLAQNMNTGKQLNNTCAATTGIEYVNFAFITKDGVAQAPANPVDSTLATFTPDATKDLFMNSGDAISVDMHDTASGFQVQISDLTTGQSGSMTASAANQFGEVQWAPPPSTACVNIPTNFHPMYSTSSPDTRVPWAAHSYNVAFSDEIGHFEYCSGVKPHTFSCNTAGVDDTNGLDVDDVGCFSPSQSSSVRVGGCLGTDSDFDGVPYQNTWPGTFSNAAQDALFHPTPIQFTSPLFNGTTKATTVAFETDLPRIEFATNPPCQRHISNPADPSPGSGCVNPPTGAAFYPFFSTTGSGSACRWQEGGSFISGASYSFGANSHDEFGPLYTLFYPAADGQPTFRYNNFNSGALTTSC
ncbi:MAG TPA: hypothetical protein VFK22_07190 [Candidatus Dormibacteraeota bacterium]|nr:hypothetical protein [Candidatus Dormibacteraeota bacterium]